MTEHTPKPKSWRDVLPVHPAAELFPMMSPDELKALGADIKANGLREAVVVYEERAGGKCSRSVLDGRNRLDAMELAGIETTTPGRGRKFELFVLPRAPSALVDGVHVVSDIDPWAYVLSANVHRRHLTAEQKREIVATVLKAQPEKSNRAIGRETKTHHTTVGAVRGELEGRGEISHVETVTDSKGRQQPARKAKPKPTPTAAHNGAVDRAVERSPAAQAQAERIAQAAPSTTKQIDLEDLVPTGQRPVGEPAEHEPERPTAREPKLRTSFDPMFTGKSKAAIKASSKLYGEIGDFAMAFQEHFEKWHADYGADPEFCRYIAQGLDLCINSLQRAQRRCNKGKRKAIVELAHRYDAPVDPASKGKHG